jgi:hypothetical protein
MTLTAEERITLIGKLEALPALLEAQVSALSPEQLLARPLAGEWSVAQNVHHLADSHLNAYVRTKLMLTEENPTFKPYSQDAWAETIDANHADLAPSFAILRGLHARWVLLLQSLDEPAFARTGLHPEYQRLYTVDDILRIYGNHGEGHLDQIRRTLEAQEG